MHRLLIASLTILLGVSSLCSSAEVEIKLRFSKAVHSQAFSGRVLVLFSQSRRDPRFGPGWFRPEKFVALDVKDWKPGEVLSLGTAETKKMLAFPKPFKNMKLKGYKAQAVARFNARARQAGNGPGNGFSQVVLLDTEKPDGPIELVINEVVPERKFVESKWTKLLRIRSQLLSQFHGHDVYMNARVTLPASYFEKPERKYPAIFTIPGFGGTHFGQPRMQPVKEDNEHGVEFLRVTLDPSCPLGHHVFADSANNGPVGKALIEEFIPAFEQRFRGIAAARGRFLKGHSSGGWSSLWLQVTYPDFFGGTWSTAPDPIDFRDFQLIDVYRPNQNVYRDVKGHPRPLARSGDQVLLTFESFARMEWTVGPGGQLHSFEAVFSPRGPDGKPLLLWDRDSGRVNADVAKTWKKYDIRLILEQSWPELAPKLKGKLHVITGGLDTFYLDGAVRLLKTSLAKLSDDPVVEVHPGKTHGSLLTRELRQRIYREMVASFQKHAKE